MNDIHVKFGPLDPLNPGFGYELRIADRGGNIILHINIRPGSGKDLILIDCLDVVSMYIPNSRGQDYAVTV